MYDRGNIEAAYGHYAGNIHFPRVYSLPALHLGPGLVLVPATVLRGGPVKVPAGPAMWPEARHFSPSCVPLAMKQLLTLAALLTFVLPLAAQTATTTPAPTAAVAVSAKQRQAAEELLQVMHMEENMNKSIDQMVTMQVQQRPDMKSVEPELRTFMTKHMSWATLKDDMVQLYAAEFTEKDLRSLTAFYKSAAGQKLLDKQPELLRATMQMGQQRLQQNIPELQQLIEKKMQSQEDKP